MIATNAEKRKYVYKSNTYGTLDDFQGGILQEICNLRKSGGFLYCNR